VAPVLGLQQLHRSSSVSNTQHVQLGTREKKSSLPVAMKYKALEGTKEKEMELRHVNEEIKSTLMVLLNFEGGKNKRYTTGVQTRLIDIEERDY
jgi:hypothetical protein